MPPSTDKRDLYKAIVLLQSLPSTFDRTKNGVMSNVMVPMGESDNNIGGLFGNANFLVETAVTDQDRSAVDQARDSMLVNTASGKHLTDLGANYGVPRPPQSPYDDELFRRIIPVLAWLPKTPYLVPYRLAEVIFGTQAVVLDTIGYAWQFYEVNANEIIFECPIDLIKGDTSTAGYMHGYPGNTDAVVGLTDTFTSTGPDARLAVANSNLAGRTLYMFHTGAWQTYSIVSATYNAGTQVNTIVVGAATIPSGNNYPFYIDVPAANSWNPGDYMLDDASLAAGSPQPDADRLVYLFGKGRLDIFEFYMNNFVRASGVTLRTEVL